MSAVFFGILASALSAAGQVGAGVAGNVSGRRAAEAQADLEARAGRIQERQEEFSSRMQERGMEQQKTLLEHGLKQGAEDAKQAERDVSAGMFEQNLGRQVGRRAGLLSKSQRDLGRRGGFSG